jgi:hypothetical protein
VCQICVIFKKIKRYSLKRLGIRVSTDGPGGANRFVCIAKGRVADYRWSHYWQTNSLKSSLFSPASMVLASPTVSRVCKLGGESRLF